MQDWKGPSWVLLLSTFYWVDRFNDLAQVEQTLLLLRRSSALKGRRFELESGA